MKLNDNDIFTECSDATDCKNDDIRMDDEFDCGDNIVCTHGACHCPKHIGVPDGHHHFGGMPQHHANQ